MAKNQFFCGVNFFQFFSLGMTQVNQSYIAHAWQAQIYRNISNPFGRLALHRIALHCCI